MKKTLLSILIPIGFTAFAQVTPPPPPVNISGTDTPPVEAPVRPDVNDENRIYSYADVSPEYPGGTKAFTREVAKHIDTRRLEETDVAGKSLRAFVKFVIEPNGTISNIEVVRDPGYSIGKQIIAGISSIKEKWTPGKIADKPVRVQYNLPITVIVPDDTTVPAQKNSSTMIAANPGQKDKYGTYLYAGLDERPDFPGGLDVFQKQVAEKINIEKYKQSGSLGLNIQMAFIVEANGTLSNIEVWNGQEATTAKEAVDAAKAIKTKWKPGKYDGKPVKSGMSIAIFVPLNTAKKSLDSRDINHTIEVVDVPKEETYLEIAPTRPLEDDNQPVMLHSLDIKPEFPGGVLKFSEFIVSNFKKENIADGTEGKDLKVTFSFIVEKDGRITDVKILRDPGYGLGKETQRVVKLLKTKWSPGILKGKPVRSHYVFPLVYRNISATEDDSTSEPPEQTPIQDSNTGSKDDHIIYAAVQVKPQYPGGMEAFKKYVSDSINKANLSKEAVGKELRTHISFIIEKDGTLSSFQLLKDPGFGMGKEAMRALQTATKKWTPGTQDGKPVRVFYILPLVYTVQK